MIVTWFTPARRSFEWFGQTDKTLALIERGGTSAVASVIGPPGGVGDIPIDPDTGNRLTRSTAGLFVPPVAQGELPDMNLIFENALI